MLESRPEATTNSVQDFFKRYGGTAPENYQRYFVPLIGAPFAADLIEAAALRPRERVLDVACGTGVVTRLAKERVGAGEVAGLDLNPCMLEVARGAAPGSESIKWHEASAEAMPFEADAFDVVLCQLGLQFVADKPAALREMRRVLMPGGRLLLSVVGPTPPLFALMADALARHINPQAAKFMDVVFSLHDAAQLAQMITAAGLREVAVRPYTKPLPLPAPAEFLWQYVRSTPLSALVGEATDESRAKLECDLVAAWERFVENGSMLCPVGAVIASARR